MLEHDVGRPQDAPLGDVKRWFNIRVDDSIHSIPAEEVVEISPPREATRIPGAPGTILGLINHRGAVVTVVDLGRLLGRRKLCAPDHRLVLVRRGAHLIALAASDVVGFGDSLDAAFGETAIPIDLDDLFRGVFNFQPAQVSRDHE
jgi:hypothetical protein